MHDLFVVGDLILLKLHDVLLVELLLVGKGSGCMLRIPTNDYLLPITVVIGTSFFTTT